MEQLAERRMQREEDTQYGIAAAHQSIHDGHNHGPLNEDDYDDEEDEDYDSQEEEEYEEDEMVRQWLSLLARSQRTTTDNNLGCHDRRAAHGRGTKDVPNICSPNV